MLSRLKSFASPRAIPSMTRKTTYVPCFFKHTLSNGEIENFNKLDTVYNQAMQSKPPGRKIALGVHYELYPGPMNEATRITRQYIANCSEFLTIKYRNTAHGKKAWFHNLPLKERWKLNSLRCILPQSIGCEQLGISGEMHEGENLRLALTLASENFGSVLVLVDDLVQRFTYQIYDPSLSSSSATELAIKTGKEWKERNQNILEQFSNIEAVPTWLDYTASLEFQEKMFEVRTLYNNNDTVKQEINNAAETFLSRYEHRTEKLHGKERTRAFNLTLTYLLEECALTTLFSRSSKYTYAPHIQDNMLTTFNNEEMNHDLTPISIKPS